MADRAKFLDFMDMIDGGGRGQMGGEFQGGGIFSQLANLIATPYGSEDPERRKARQRASGLLDKIGTKEEQAAAASRAAATPSVVKRSAPEATTSPRPQLRPTSPPATDPYAPLGGPNPAVQAEIQRRQEVQRMMGINQPMGAGGRAQVATSPSMVPAGMPAPTGRGVAPAAAPMPSGYQAVPTMTNYNPTVPAMARGIATGNQFSPVFSQDYADYLEYLTTGRYPRG